MQLEIFVQMVGVLGRDLHRRWRLLAIESLVVKLLSYMTAQGGVGMLFTIVLVFADRRRAVSTRTSFREQVDLSLDWLQSGEPVPEHVVDLALVRYQHRLVFFVLGRSQPVPLLLRRLLELLT